jgi:DnaJ-class molecular chaperone
MVCYGIGKLSTHFTSSKLVQKLTSPCPVCGGIGLDMRTCPPFIREVKVVPVKLPPGSREGYKVSLPNEGNEVIENGVKVTGNLDVTIQKVHSRNLLLLENYVELNIKLTVMEALQVFKQLY